MRATRQALANYCIGGALMALCWSAGPAARAQVGPGPLEPAPVGDSPPCYGAPPCPTPVAPAPPTLTKEKNEIPDDVPNAFDETHPAHDDYWGHVGIDVGLYIFLKRTRVTDNPAFSITTAPQVQRFVTNPNVTTSNPNFILPTGAPYGPATTTQFDFDFGKTVAPVIAAQIVNDYGFGFRMRWFGFDQNAKAVTPASGGGAIPLRPLTNSDVSAGILPFGALGNTFIHSASPFLGFGVNSPDTSRLLDPLLAPGIPMPIGRTGPGDDDPNFGPPTGLAQSLLANGVPSDVLTFSESLRVEAWDFEAMQDLPLDRFGIQVSAGARYAYISQTYYANRFHALGGFELPTIERGRADDFIGVFVNRDDANLIGGESFSGIGPTLSARVEYRVPWLGGLTAFGMVRGSVLFGHQKQTAFQTTHFTGTARLVRNEDNDFAKLEYFTTPFNGSTFIEAENRTSQTVPQWDYEVGVGWGQNVGRAGFSAQVSVFGQEWDGIGSPANLDSDLRLFGLKAEIGMDY